MSAGLGRGGGTHAVEQLTALAKLDGVRITVFATGDLARDLARNGGDIDVRCEPQRSLAARLLWEQFVLARRTDPYDVVYSTGNFALFLARRPQVVALQTMNHFGHAARSVRRRMPRKQAARLALESFVARRSLRRVESALVVSRALQEAVEEDMGPSSHVRVVRSAPAVLPGPDAMAKGSRSLPQGRYVISVGHDYHHKDWDGLISAFLRHPDLPRLVLVGARRDDRRQHELEERIRRAGSPPRVELVGHLDDRKQLAALYRGAECCVVHSHLESFSLTPYEAGSVGTSVVVSDIPAHREMCGDAAIYYDAGDPDALAGAVRRSLADPTPGWGTYAARTWEDNAQELLEVLRVVAATEKYDAVSEPLGRPQ